MAQQIHDVMALLDLVARTHVYNYAHYAHQSHMSDPHEDEDDDNESTGFDQFGNSLHYVDPADPAEEINKDGDSTRDSASQDIDDIPRLYNTMNAIDSDIIVRYDGGRADFLAQKRALSSMSGYFERALSGGFPVASSDVIDLGDEDCTKHIHAMLCFIHGSTYTKIHQRCAVGRNLDFHIDLYMMGEQFDVPDLREFAADAFRREAVFFADTSSFPMAVSRVIGPDAPVLADQQLVEVIIKICTEQSSILVENERFVLMARTGELADEEMMVRLFLARGQHIRDMPRMTREEVFQSQLNPFDDIHAAMLRAENAMGPGPWDRSTITGQILTARARNAAWTALTNLALLVPQPTWAPPPAILTSQPPTAAVLGHLTVARVKTSLFGSIRMKASKLKKILSSPFRKTPSA